MIVGSLWDELSKQLADRWMSLLVLPGALYLAAVGVAITLGHSHPFDAGLLVRRVTEVARDPSVRTTGGQVLLLVAAVMAAAAAGVVAQGLGAILERVTMAGGWNQWPVPIMRAVTWWVALRRYMWDRQDRKYTEQLLLARLPDPAQRPSPGRRYAAAGRRARISLERPERPTWTGDRIQAAVLRMDRDHWIDLAVVWPYLERVMPESMRKDIAEAREALSRAAVQGGWALLYAALTWWWWPAVLLALTLAAASRRRLRASGDAYARLLETAARLYIAALAAQLGIDHTGPLDRSLGGRVTSHLRPQQPSRSIDTRRRTGSGRSTLGRGRLRAGVHIGGPQPREAGIAVSGAAYGAVERGGRAGGIEEAGADG